MWLQKNLTIFYCKKLYSFLGTYTTFRNNINNGYGYGYDLRKNIDFPLFWFNFPQKKVHSQLCSHE